mmetsp:Transcript_18634/g.39995  ORF Transcript_18634/g.39995 Transcript_18634/m.39995 type:complete len:532 (+) Transcript_18634:71-1666(+)
MPWSGRMLIAFLGSSSRIRRQGQGLLPPTLPPSSSHSSSWPVQARALLQSGEIITARSGGDGQRCCLSMMSSNDSKDIRSGRGRSGRNANRSNSRNRKGNHGRMRRGRLEPPTPPPGQPGRERHRSCICIGSDVYVVKKEDQRTGRESKGTVSRLLTKSAYHPRGIKVMLRNGVVGRVTRISGDTAAAAANDNDATLTIPSSESNIAKKRSLSEYLREEGMDGNLSHVVMAAAKASSCIADDLRKLSLLDGVERSGSVNVQGEEQKGMDVHANAIFIRHLKPVVVTMVSEEEEGILPGNAVRSPGKAQYEIAFDPLDGSSNLDVAAPTGSIFGIFRRSDDAGSPFESPPRQSMVAAGYTLYSSSTELVLAGLGKHVVGFTLDPQGTFRLSNPGIVCPDRGPYYSLNEAREPDWPDGLRRWIDDAKRGRTPAGTAYSARYVCSLAADFHRTLLKGGWAGNPRPHLRLLYEAAPLAFVAEKAGGAGSDGVAKLLDVEPAGLHHRVCCFLGSKLDMEDLVAYGDVQQKGKQYET